MSALILRLLSTMRDAECCYDHMWPQPMCAECHEALVSQYESVLWAGLSVGQRAFNDAHDLMRSKGLRMFHHLFPEMVTDLPGFEGTVEDYCNAKADLAERAAFEDAQWWADMDRQAREQDHHDYEISIMRGIPMF